MQALLRLLCDFISQAVHISGSKKYVLPGADRKEQYGAHEQKPRLHNLRGLSGLSI